MNTPPIYEIKNLKIEYNGKTILEDINLKIENGEKILLYGKSGVGKTSLVKAMLGFINPPSGKIIYKGKELTPKTVWDIRKEVAYIPQDIRLGIGKVINFIKEITHFKANRHLHIEENLELLQRLGFTKDIYKKEMDSLSGGEKQRICIYIALLLGRKIFILDEATSSIDIKLRKKIIDMFLSNPEYTIISISHDVEWQDKRIKIINIERFLKQ